MIECDCKFIKRRNKMSDLSNIEEKMKKSVSVFAENLSEVRAGRANPAILNKISISYMELKLQ